MQSQWQFFIPESPVAILIAAFLLILTIFLENRIQRRLQHIILPRAKERGIFIYALFLLPGVFIHEFSHWIVALFIGGNPTSFSLWPKKSEGGLQMGAVQYQSQIGVIRQSIIGAAPLFGGVLTLWVLSQIDVPVYLYPVWVYLYFVIANGMSPSPSDRAAWGSAILLIVVALTTLFGASYLLDIPVPIPSFAPVYQLSAEIAPALAIAVIIDLLLLPILWQLRKKH